MTECETEWTGLCRYLVSLPQHRLVSDIFTSIWLPVSVSHTRCAPLFFLPHGLTGPPQEPFHTLLSHHSTRHLGHVSHRARRGSVERTRQAKAKGFPLVFFCLCASPTCWFVRVSHLRGNQFCLVECRRSNMHQTPRPIAFDIKTFSTAMTAHVGSRISVAVNFF